MAPRGSGRVPGEASRGDLLSFPPLNPARVTPVAVGTDQALHWGPLTSNTWADTGVTVVPASMKFLAAETSGSEVCSQEHSCHRPQVSGKTP